MTEGVPGIWWATYSYFANLNRYLNVHGGKSSKMFGVKEAYARFDEKETSGSISAEFLASPYRCKILFLYTCAYLFSVNVLATGFQVWPSDCSRTARLRHLLMLWSQFEGESYNARRWLDWFSLDLQEWLLLSWHPNLLHKSSPNGWLIPAIYIIQDENWFN